MARPEKALQGHGLVKQGLQLLVVGGLAARGGGRSRLSSNVLQQSGKEYDDIRKPVRYTVGTNHYRYLLLFNIDQNGTGLM